MTESRLACAPKGVSARWLALIVYSRFDLFFYEGPLYGPPSLDRP